MTLVLELTLEQERQSKDEARQRNLDMTSYAKTVLFSKEQQQQRGEQNARPDEDEPWNGADLVVYWEREGVIGSRPDITDSLEHARAIRRKAERCVRE